MTLLCIDTAHAELVMALHLPDESLLVLPKDALPNLVTPNQHASLFFPALVWLLTKANLSIDDVDAVAINTGPGSFTGLRVGLTVVNMLAAFAPQTMAFYAMTTFELLAAHPIYRGHSVTILLDAFRGRHFKARLTVLENGLVHAEQPPEIIPNSDFDRGDVPHSEDQQWIIQDSLLKQLPLEDFNPILLSSVLGTIPETMAFLVASQPQVYLLADKTQGLLPNYMQLPNITVKKTVPRQ